VSADAPTWTISESDKAEVWQRFAMFQAAFATLPFIESGLVGHYFGPEEGFHDAVCVKFKDLAAYREHARAPHGPDEANDLRKHVRVKSPYAVGC